MHGTQELMPILTELSKIKITTDYLMEIITNFVSLNIRQ